MIGGEKEGVKKLLREPWSERKGMEKAKALLCTFSFHVVATTYARREEGRKTRQIQEAKRRTISYRPDALADPMLRSPSVAFSRAA